MYLASDREAQHKRNRWNEINICIKSDEWHSNQKRFVPPNVECYRCWLDSSFFIIRLCMQTVLAAKTNDFNCVPMVWQITRIYVTYIKLISLNQSFKHKFKNKNAFHDDCQRKWDDEMREKIEKKSRNTKCFLTILFVILLENKWI